MRACVEIVCVCALFMAELPAHNYRHTNTTQALPHGQQHSGRRTGSQRHEAQHHLQTYAHIRNGTCCRHRCRNAFCLSRERFTPTQRKRERDYKKNRCNCLSMLQQYYTRRQTKGRAEEVVQKLIKRIKNELEIPRFQTPLEAEHVPPSSFDSFESNIGPQSKMCSRQHITTPYINKTRNIHTHSHTREYSPSLSSYLRSILFAAQTQREIESKTTQTANTLAHFLMCDTH